MEIVQAHQVAPASEVEVIAAASDITSAPASLVEWIAEREKMFQLEQTPVQLLECVEEEIGKWKTMTKSEIIELISFYATKADDYASMAQTNCAFAIVWAWGCGNLLNRTKSDVGHGNFSEWRTKYFVNRGFSERSSTRYMLLARTYKNIRGVLERSTSLRQAYIACGALPEPPPTDRPAGEKTPAAVLRKGVRNVQKSVQLFTKSLDRFKGSNETLSPEQKEEIYLMKAAIGNFMQRINDLLP